MELNPDKFFRYDVFSLMNDLRVRFAAYVGADEDDLTFVPNASEGVNSVLRSLKVPAGKKIMLLNLAYYMVKATSSYLASFASEQVTILSLPHSH
jgi:selenocysteine lyase/cysteine desulfurase